MLDKRLRIRTVVMKNTMDDDGLGKLVDDKKTAPFRSVLRRTRRADIAVESVTLGYSCITSASGTYEADYFRQAVHTLSVDGNVSEVVFGGATFPARSRSALHTKISGRLGGNSKVDIPVEEHVRVECKGRFHLGGDGNEVKFPYKSDDPSGVEHYPRRALGRVDSARVEGGFADSSYDKLAARLAELLRPDLGQDIRDLAEEMIVRDAVLTYVPVYEVALAGPRGRTAVMRIDAALGRVVS